MAQSIPAKSPGAEIICHDPATGEEIGRAPLTMPEEVARAVGRARDSQPAWSAKSYRERGRMIMAAREVILKEMEEIAFLISIETGKPVAEAISLEIAPALDLMQYFARKTASLLAPRRIGIGQYWFMGRTSYEIYKPLGVVGIISPWNFPFSTPLDEVTMALMAGDTVVLKPSELTPLTGLKIQEIMTRAGLPEGVLQVVTGDGSTGAALVAAGTNKIMFTGSVATGKRVAESAAKYLIPVVLELGGKDPMVVLDDANVENAARGAVWGAFANCGQSCSSVERCYVHEDISEQFISAVVRETQRLHQGNGTEKAIDIGSMSSERQLRTVELHVNQAVANGATALTGGERLRDIAGAFYPPTVLTNVNHQMDVMREETFGPVLPIMTFRTEDEAIRLANDSDFGLTASVWSNSIPRAQRIAARIDAGTVMINEVLYTHGIAQAPWGGVKQSGLGRTHGRAGLLELVNAQHIHVNRLPFIPDLWWFNYDEGAGHLFRGFARRFASGSIFQTLLLLPQMIRRWRER
ncbi:MAG TPA: aldehyde dehydrogenase family protein [Pyrinomonadaceae bacterium]|nr:aldehyde dehydrogenase family protein [Pyrinomonadaceae bacterium]